MLLNVWGKKEVKVYQENIDVKMLAKNYKNNEGYVAGKILRVFQFNLNLVIDKQEQESTL